MSITNKQRLDLIEQYVREHRYADLHNLAEAFDISLSTVRRALSELESKGVVRRHHGGASLVEDENGGGGYDFITQDSHNTEEKYAIARHVSKMVQPGMTVLLDGGTTTYAVARALISKRLVVVTNSLPIAALYNDAGSSEIILTGGSLYNRLGVLYGPLCEQAISEMHTDLAIIGGAGLTSEGLWNNNSFLVSCQKHMIKAADKTIVVLDSSKLNRRTLTFTVPFDKKFSIITAGKIPSDIRQAAEAAGTTMEVAPMKED